jgi:hypothetical protein
MSSVDEKNYEWFEANLSDLMREHRDKYLIIYEESLRGVFSDIEDAITEALTFAKPGEFLIQRCVPEDESTEVLCSLIRLPNLV